MQIQEPVEWMHMGSEVLPQIRTRKPRRSSRPHWPVQSLYSPSSQLPAARALGTGGRFSRIIGQWPVVTQAARYFSKYSALSSG